MRGKFHSDVGNNQLVNYENIQVNFYYYWIEHGTKGEKRVTMTIERQNARLQNNIIINKWNLTKLDSICNIVSQPGKLHIQFDGFHQHVEMETKRIERKREKNIRKTILITITFLIMKMNCEHEAGAELHVAL